MMTPSELREYEFKSAGRNAYKSDDVDNFFGEVAVAYEKLYRENIEYAKRVSLLADRLEQFKQDEDQIKQAVIGAQKAADIIVKEAEMSIADSKEEAEAILAAAKGEAEVIKSDAEKQAIADSDLLLSIARDKAEEIINKAKEEARGIIIEANDSAKDTVGAATRTITSESIHYEMLKKEVSDFRASILAQYKAHIEMISKLPELAVEEADKVEATETAVDDDIVDEIKSVDPENNIIEYIDNDTDNEFSDEIKFSENEEESDGELVVKTNLPFDFFEETTPIEFVENEDDESDESVKVSDIDEKLAIVNDDTDDVVSENKVEDQFVSEQEESEENKEIVEKEELSDDDSSDIPISKGFTINAATVSDDIDVFSETKSESRPAIFDSFGTIDDEDDEDDDVEDEPKKKFGLFRRKK